MLISNMPEPEKFKFSNVSIKDLLKKEVNEEGEGNKKVACPILLSHQNNKEVKEKILHLDCPESKVSKVFTAILTKVGGK